MAKRGELTPLYPSVALYGGADLDQKTLGSNPSPAANRHKSALQIAAGGLFGA